MTWRDELSRVTLPDGRRLIGASFRGVPFFVDATDRTGGRRVVVHEFPGRDEPFVEDLGRRARTFPIAGYVIGADYVRQRDALVAALEDDASAGELVHPYYGVRRAVCSGLVVRETRAEGGMAVLQIDFTEAPAGAPAPTEAPDLGEKVETAAAAARVSVQAELEEDYSADGEPGYAVQILADELEQRAEQLREGLGAIAQTTQELARLEVEVDSLVSQATTLIRSPVDTAEAFLAVMGSLTDTLVEAPGEVLAALVDTYRLDALPDAVGITATRVLERANQAALTAALRRLVAIEAARLLPAIEYRTLESAQADRSTVVELLDEQAETAGDAAYPALVNLRAAVVRAIPGDQVLARIIDVDRPVAIPSLLLSYQLYGSIAQEADVVARNRIRHPGVMAGTLKVLSRG